MDLGQLRQLDAIDAAGTLSAAADAVHLSQPALSRSLARLERELGTPLFDRPGRRLVLNDAGRATLVHARAILREERALRSELADLARAERTLRVGTVAPAPLWRLTALMVERFPERVLTSETLGDEAVLDGVLAGALDLGICLRPHPLPTLRSVPLMTENLSVSLPEGHPLAGRDSVALGDLDGESVLLYAAIGFWREVCERAMPSARFLVQEDREVFLRLLTPSAPPYFLTDAPALAGSEVARGGRCLVPVADAAAHATFYLLRREDLAEQAAEVFDWVRAQRG